MPNKSLNEMHSPDSQPETSASTLLPMLIGGLVLIVIGAIVVMNFV